MRWPARGAFLVTVCTWSSCSIDAVSRRGAKYPSGASSWKIGLAVSADLAVSYGAVTVVREHPLAILVTAAVGAEHIRKMYLYITHTALAIRGKLHASALKIREPAV